MTSPEIAVATLDSSLKIPDGLIPTTIARTADVATIVGSIPTTATKASVGLGNVDNTADVDKPVSSPTLAMFGRIRALWKQVGASYPTPLPTGYFGIAFEGVNDPADQSGLTVTNNDSWTQLQA